jgi:serine/threonine protein phosphatase PrpC
LKYQDKAEGAKKDFDEQFNVLFDGIDQLHHECSEIAQKFLIETLLRLELQIAILRT